MKYILALALLIGSFPASSASDGYVGWSELSFHTGPWTIHIATSSDGSRISDLSISQNGAAIPLPPSATESLRNPLLNGVKLLSVCCSDQVRLEVPVLQFDQSGHATERVWEIHVAGGKFEGAAYRQAPSQRAADEP
jgi:hypothetical protein